MRQLSVLGQQASADRSCAHGIAYGLPTIVTSCSNNYGPFSFSKADSLTILNALASRPIAVYGRGRAFATGSMWRIARSLLAVMERGKIGTTYAIGARAERRNIDVVESVCGILDELKPRHGGGRYRELIEFVADRPGHDYRYAIDPSTIERELSWRPTELFETGLRKTVGWYLGTMHGAARVRSGAYRGERLGLGTGV
jgi:dTDP-glucose 4,6-dehydratase